MARHDDGGSLDAYRRKRDARRTPEPVPAEGPLPRGDDDTFVVQQHHARRLHWDFRLERGGVLVSWAIPKGLPMDPKRNNLAVHTEDHPVDYASFEGEIPQGEYGGGRVIIWDRGTYELEKWSDREVKVVLRGSRVSGRYVLFRTRNENWMIHRMDPPPEPDWQPLPERVPPMWPVARKRLPTDDAYGYEFAWGGSRAVAYVEGGRLRLLDEDGDHDHADVTDRYPELRALGEALGARQAVLDGEVVALDERGRPSGELLRRRAGADTTHRVRRAQRETPVTYVAFDLLHLDGHALLDAPYRERRAALDGLALAGARFQVAPWFEDDGDAVAAAAADQGLPGVVAKRLDAAYRPGRRSTAWLRVTRPRRG